jgi:hypothetical protein
MNFSWIIYRELNRDLITAGLKTKEEYERHFIRHGKNEGRKWNIYQIYPYFNPYIYINNYKQLNGLNIEQIELHWLNIGSKICNVNNNIKISIVMAYFNREKQTIYTLDGFQKIYSNKYNFEVILIDDNSNDSNTLNTIYKKYSFPIKYRYITKEEKGKRVNSGLAYNIGFSMASGDVIVIQNPECYHYTDILGEITKMNLELFYYTTEVISSPSFSVNEYIINNLNMNKMNIIEYLKKENNSTYNNGWYNSPNMPYDRQHMHFCSIISKSKLDMLGGFDESYSDNYWYEDNEFLFRVKKILMPIFILDSLVIHLYHENGSFSDMYNNEDIQNSIKINKNKYELLKLSKMNEMLCWKNNINNG